MMPRTDDPGPATQPDDGPAPADRAELAEQIDRMTFDAWRREPGVTLRPRDAVKSPRVQRVMVAIDGSEPSQAALAWTEELARTFRAWVTVVTVMPGPVLPETFPEATRLERIERARGEEVLEDAQARLAKSGIDAEAVMGEGDPAREVLRLAHARDADLLVLGSHGYSPVQRILLGSVADMVRRHAEAHVLIAKDQPPPSRILIPVDGSRSSKRAADLGLRLQRQWGVEATLLHVVAMPVFGPPERAETLYREALRDLEVVSRMPGVRIEVEYGHPAERIAALASTREPTLVVMGSRGLGGITSLIGGSVSNRVAHEAQASVLVVQGAETREDRRRAGVTTAHL